MALSAFCRMFADISSMEEEASSADEACSVAPCDIDSALDDICKLPAATLSAADLTSFTTSESLATMFESERISSSLAERSAMVTVRLPSATSLAALVMLLVASISVFRLFLIWLKSPLYSSTIFEGMSPLEMRST